ncbi:hypothetical protein Acr_13g0013120 [Actinidia rufa]|uniref:RING/U-box superfamily protein n=1 Tax=Actinidia rufa TaxID=165716 RepID=A0A7J0FMF7_9ERIC|nr:hypothetical protein Acr_13g0013120 [Actinidia rufa]
MHLQYSTIFPRIEGRSTSSLIQGVTLASSGTGTELPDSSFNDALHSVSRPLPYDADQRYSRLQQRDDLLGSAKKWNGVDSAEELQLGHSETSEKALATKVAHGLIYVQSSCEDEDVCPTCLDGLC